MKNSIRRTEEKDFYEISSLFNFRKSVEELKWLFRDYSLKNQYNSFVYINNSNKIVGVIGYSHSSYKYNNKCYTGVIPMSWKVSESYRGIGGVILFKRILKEGDFNFAIGGSKDAIDLYPMFKLKYISTAEDLFIILNVSDFYKSMRQRKFFKKLWTLVNLMPGFFVKARQINNSVSLIRYDGNNFVPETINLHGLTKHISKNYIDWLLDCPKLQSYAFIVNADSENLGICVFYISSENGISKGRIVHLPYSGDDEHLFEEIVLKCLDFFKNKNCSSVSLLSHKKLTKRSYLNLGFRSIPGYKRPLFVSDRFTESDSIDLDDWNIQFSEGDKAYIYI